MKVSELKEGMLIQPPNYCGWDTTQSLKKSSVPTIRINWLKNCSEPNFPAVYLGKVKLEKQLYGLYTWHKVFYNGLIYLMDGYEFHRGKIGLAE